jgi:hypothetical protein
MKLLGVLLALGVFGVALLAPGSSVAAQTTIYNNQVKVTGVILPAQHVIVDEQGIIIEILSNTTEDVMPTVYVNKLSKENIRALTPNIYQQYRRIVPAGHSRVGRLYKHTPGSYSFTSPESLLAPQTAPYAPFLSQ